VPPKVGYVYCLMELYIYIYGRSIENPSPSKLNRRERSDRQGGALEENLISTGAATEDP
jgi:hypothetical protein